MASLPQDDPEPEARAHQLAKAREHYVFDLSYEGYALAAEIPWRDRFDVRYIAEAAKNKLEVASNCAASKLSAWLEDEWEQVRDKLQADEADSRARERVSRQHPLAIEDYAEM